MMFRKLLRMASILTLSLTLSLAVLLTGCMSISATPVRPAVTSATSQASTTAGTAPAGTTASGGSVTGSIVAGGSTALQPLAQKAAELFMAKNSGASIQVQGGGSGTGLTQVAQGGFDIGNSDIYAEEKLSPEIARTLVDHRVAVVGFAVIVNPNLGVSDVTIQQLVDIFTGKVTNWKDIGGQDLPVVIMQRPASSGTRATFRKYALGGREEAQGNALTNDSNGTILKSVADTSGAISYVGLSYVNETVKALRLGGVEPTAANVADGSYPIWSYEHMYTKGPATGLAKSFIDFMTSAEFAPVIQELGYIPASEMKVSR